MHGGKKQLIILGALPDGAGRSCFTTACLCSTQIQLLIVFCATLQTHPALSFFLHFCLTFDTLNTLPFPVFISGIHYSLP